jgi:hypothetical protein
MTNREGYTPETCQRLRMLETAETYLSDYRPANSRVTVAEGQRLMQLMDAGMTAADAAEQVQAETFKG